MARRVTLKPGVDTLTIHSPHTVINAPLVFNKSLGISENTLNRAIALPTSGTTVS
jgi:hypothetical protein